MKLEEALNKEIDPEEISPITKENYNFCDIIEVNGCEIHLIGTEHHSYISRSIIEDKFENNNFDVVMPELGRTRLLDALTIMEQLDKYDDLPEEKIKNTKGKVKSDYSEFDEGRSKIERYLVSKMNKTPNLDSFLTRKLVKIEKIEGKNQEVDMAFSIKKALQTDAKIRGNDLPIIEIKAIDENSKLTKLISLPFTPILKRNLVTGIGINKSSIANYYIKEILLTEIEPKELSEKNKKELIKDNLKKSSLENYVVNIGGGNYTRGKARKILEETIDEQDFSDDIDINIDEMNKRRERYMSENILEETHDNDKILAIIGAGHFHSVKKSIQDKN